MKLPVQVEPRSEVMPDIDYRWDPDTEILSARIRVAASDPGAVEAMDGGSTTSLPIPTGSDVAMSGPVGVEGRDGSWLVLDVEGGHLAGVEVAVWPSVRQRETLAIPAVIEDGHVLVPNRKTSRRARPAFEMPTRLTAEAAPRERTIHFRLGPPRNARAIRLGRDLLVDVDDDGHLAGFWLLNVPPVPTIT